CARGRADYGNYGEDSLDVW
nr:immunoglobulin heavy chain junction region [Macaca mulatta]